MKIRNNKELVKDRTKKYSGNHFLKEYPCSSKSESFSGIPDSFFRILPPGNDLRFILYDRTGLFLR